MAGCWTGVQASWAAESRAFRRVVGCGESPVPEAVQRDGAVGEVGSGVYVKPVRSMARQALNSRSVVGCQPMIRNVVRRVRRMTWRVGRSSLDDAPELHGDGPLPVRLQVHHHREPALDLATDRVLDGVHRLRVDVSRMSPPLWSKRAVAYSPPRLLDCRRGAWGESTEKMGGTRHWYAELGTDRSATLLECPVNRPFDSSLPIHTNSLLACRVADGAVLYNEVG